MHSVEERVGEEMSRDSELSPLCKEVWLWERTDSSPTCLKSGWGEGGIE